MGGPPPPYGPPPPGSGPSPDPREQRRYWREQARMQREAMRAQQMQMRYQARGYRRSSVVGPLLLIAVGVLFLLLETGRLPWQLFWDWYGRHWPLLLIFVGVILLAEWAIEQLLDHDPERPRYRRSLGGGAFLLLLIFTLAGIAANIVHMPNGGSFPGWHFTPDDMDQFLGDKHESDQTLDQAFAAGSTLVVSNPRGDVTVNGTSNDARIHVSVHKQVYARSDSDADGKAQRFSPSMTVAGQTVSLSMPSVESSRADLVITLPAAAAVTVTANRGDIHIASIKAAVVATANRGDIALSAINGSVTAHTNSNSVSFSASGITGPLTLEGHAEDVTLSEITGPVSISGEFFGTTHLERLSGATRFHTSRTDLQFERLDGQVEINSHGISGDRLLGPVVLTTSNRDVTLDRAAGNISVTDRNGSVDLSVAPALTTAPDATALGSISLANHNGSVRLVLPEHAGFTVDASTSNGNVDTDFPLSTQESHNRKSLNGTVGAGGPTVHIATANGDISIHKSTGAPLSTKH